MKRIIAIVLLAGFVSFLSCKSKPKPTGPAHTLKMRLANGDKFGQDMDMDMKIGMKAGGVNMDMNMTMNMSIDMEVLGDTADMKKLKFTYTSAKMGLDIQGLPGGTPGLGTKEIMDEAAEKITGKSMVLLLTRKNEIADVLGFEEMITDGDNPDVDEQIKKMFSKDQLNNMMGIMFSMYPDKAVQVGESWEKEADLNFGPVNMRVKNNFTLKEVVNGVAKVEINAKYTGNGKMEQKGMNLDMEMDGTQKGEIGISSDNGYLKGADYKLDMKARAKIMGQKVPYDIKANYTMKGH
jgi:hypothetical protein